LSLISYFPLPRVIEEGYSVSLLYEVRLEALDSKPYKLLPSMKRYIDIFIDSRPAENWG